MTCAIGGKLSWTIVNGFLTGRDFFSFPRNLETLFGFHTFYSPRVPGGLHQRIRWPKHEAGRASLSGARIVFVWICNNNTVHFQTRFWSLWLDPRLEFSYTRCSLASQFFFFLGGGGGAFRYSRKAPPVFVILFVCPCVCSRLSARLPLWWNRTETSGTYLKA
jgi:hypothetical protein